jgi:hypothetical protein
VSQPLLNAALLVVGWLLGAIVVSTGHSVRVARAAQRRKPVKFGDVAYHVVAIDDVRGCFDLVTRLEREIEARDRSIGPQNRAVREVDTSPAYVPGPMYRRPRPWEE